MESTFLGMCFPFSVHRFLLFVTLGIGSCGFFKVFLVIVGKSLVTVKSSFSNVANELLDWNYGSHDDYCSWRGVGCDNLTFAVVSL